jgi:hypothetical protein
VSSIPSSPQTKQLKKKTEKKNKKNLIQNSISTGDYLYRKTEITRNHTNAKCRKFPTKHRAAEILPPH